MVILAKEKVEEVPTARLPVRRETGLTKRGMSPLPPNVSSRPVTQDTRAWLPFRSESRRMRQFIDLQASPQSSLERSLAEGAAAATTLIAAVPGQPIAKKRRHPGRPPQSGGVAAPRRNAAVATRTVAGAANAAAATRQPPGRGAQDNGPVRPPQRWSCGAQPLQRRRHSGRLERPPPPEIALLVRKPWIDLILAGKKTWEIRGMPTSVRRWIHLAQSGTGSLVGRARVVGCLKVPREELPGHVDKHCVLDCGIVRYARVFAWVLEGAERLAAPRPYVHPQGAITWVRLPPDMPPIPNPTNLSLGRSEPLSWAGSAAGGPSSAAGATAGSPVGACLEEVQDDQGPTAVRDLRWADRNDPSPSATKGALVLTCRYTSTVLWIRSQVELQQGGVAVRLTRQVVWSGKLISEGDLISELT